MNFGCRFSDWGSDLVNSTSVLDYIPPCKQDLSPDILTFGCLAMCCTSLKEGTSLLSDMQAFGAKPNSEIMTALIKGDYQVSYH